MYSVYPRLVKCPDERAGNVKGMGLLKALLKLTVLLLVGAAIAGAVALIKRPKSASEVSYEQWPSVPVNPNN